MTSKKVLFLTSLSGNSICGTEINLLTDVNIYFNSTTTIALRMEITYPGPGVASSIIGGGHIFIYSCYGQLVSFEIDCFYGLRTRIYEYMPPPPIIELATGLNIPLLFPRVCMDKMFFHHCLKILYNSLQTVDNNLLYLGYLLQGQVWTFENQFESIDVHY